MGVSNVNIHTSLTIDPPMSIATKISGTLSSTSASIGFSSSHPYPRFKAFSNSSATGRIRSPPSVLPSPAALTESYPNVRIRAFLIPPFRRGRCAGSTSGSSDVEKGSRSLSHRVLAGLGVVGLEAGAELVIMGMEEVFVLLVEGCAPALTLGSASGKSSM